MSINYHVILLCLSLVAFYMQGIDNLENFFLRGIQFLRDFSAPVPWVSGVGINY